MQPLIYVYTQYNNIYQWIQLFFNETNLIAVFAVYRNKHLYFCLEEYFEKKKKTIFLGSCLCCTILPVILQFLKNQLLKMASGDI